MLSVPQRQAFSSREEFAAAVTDAFANFWGIYEDAPILHAEPEWTRTGRGSFVFNVQLPIAIARDGNDAHALASALKALVEKRKSIKRIARVESGETWRVWIETD